MKSQIRPLILTFDDAVFLSDTDLLCLLKKIDNVTLLQACSRCDDQLLKRITGQFSQTAKEYFYDDMTKLGDVSDEAASMAQERITQVLIELYRRGSIKNWHTKYAA
jgi:flagellar motor switch protein FliG